MALEQPSGLASPQIPKSHSLIPRRTDQETVVIGKGKVTDEVGMSI